MSPRIVRSPVKNRVWLANLHGWVCWYCGIEVDVKNSQVDHIVPISGGGSSTFENLALTCAMCNRAKWTLSKQDFLAWLNWVRSGQSKSIIDNDDLRTPDECKGQPKWSHLDVEAPTSV